MSVIGNIIKRGRAGAKTFNTAKNIGSYEKLVKINDNLSFTKTISPNNKITKRIFSEAIKPTTNAGITNAGILKDTLKDTASSVWNSFANRNTTWGYMGIGAGLGLSYSAMSYAFPNNVESSGLGNNIARGAAIGIGLSAMRIGGGNLAKANLTGNYKWLKTAGSYSSAFANNKWTKMAAIGNVMMNAGSVSLTGPVNPAISSRR